MAPDVKAAILERIAVKADRGTYAKTGAEMTLALEKVRHAPGASDELRKLAEECLKALEK